MANLRRISLLIFDYQGLTSAWLLRLLRSMPSDNILEDIGIEYRVNSRTSDVMRQGHWADVDRLLTSPSFPHFRRFSLDFPDNEENEYTYDEMDFPMFLATKVPRMVSRILFTLVFKGVTIVSNSST
jgi:hypothetical protein